jgi:FdhE protein
VTQPVTQAVRTPHPAADDGAAEARWNALLASRPELAPTIALQRRLLSIALEGVSRLIASPPAVPEAALQRAVERLGAGIPVFRADQAEPPAPVLAPLLRDFAEVLYEGGAGEAALHIVEALDGGRVSTSSWLAAAFTRDADVLQGGSVETGLSLGLLWLIGDLAIAPWSARLSAALETRAAQEPALQQALDGWERGYCPACGSWPAMGSESGKSWDLRCSLCAFTWTHAANRCLFCSSTAPLQHIDAPAGGPAYAAACEGCGAYVKILPRGDASLPFPFLAVADLETSDLDHLSVQRGFGKPPLPAIPGVASARPPCPGVG